jgi:hypothetical protein
MTVTQLLLVGLLSAATLDAVFSGLSRLVAR